MKKEHILIVGAAGQIGTELTTALRRLHGDYYVVAADVKPAGPGLEAKGPYETLDALDNRSLASVIDRYGISQVYLLAAMLSATGEQHPQKAWHLNTQALLNTLELAKEKKLNRVFWPSTIAVFGPDAPKNNCPQDVRLAPATMYGISKAAGENLCHYYFTRYGVDVRSLRYPGLISYEAPPGGGTTDYAIDIFHQALKKKSYTCFLNADTRLPMLYMPDAIRATLELMNANSSDIRIRTSYNLAGLSFTPGELASAIANHIPEFTINYQPDFRQDIADSWPRSIDDTPARSHWGWEYEYGLHAMTHDMLLHLSQKNGSPSQKLSAATFF